MKIADLKLGQKVTALVKTKTFWAGMGIVANALYASQTTQASFSDAMFQALMGIGLGTGRYAILKQQSAEDITSGGSTSPNQ